MAPRRPPNLHPLHVCFPQQDILRRDVLLNLGHFTTINSNQNFHLQGKPSLENAGLPTPKTPSAAHQANGQAAENAIHRS